MSELSYGQYQILSHPGEVLSIEEYQKKIYILSEESLRSTGNLKSIQDSFTFLIERGRSLSETACIENLIELGYHQSDHPGESGTYKRLSSLIHIYREESEYTIEFFDDHVDSIVEVTRGNRRHRETIIISRNGSIERVDQSPVSKELLSTLSEIPTLLIGGEFMNEREYIHETFSNVIEFSYLRRDGSHHLDIKNLFYEDLAGLIAGEKEQNHSTYSFTRYEKKLGEIYDLNSLSGFIFPALTGGESFCIHADLVADFFHPLQKKNEKKDLHIIADDIYANIFVQNRLRKATIKNLDLLLKIHPGDLIVHREHGVGKFLGMLTKRIGLIEREYIEIEYAQEARVFVPMTELSRITKYVGDEAKSLSHLEGKEWEKTISKTDEEIRIIAEDILATEARRSLTERIPFGRFVDEERAFFEAFPYTHTPDQKGIIEEIRSDMESAHPMDRLVAGDVGFGKTEVAMNAVYKAVLSGAQVAVISPLLILAEEHRETFEERLGAFGVRIASLTRMTSQSEARSVISGLKKGEIDVVVGTHRLLSEDIGFRRLGLLVIDEEHRFGVIQKEAIKKMKAHVDILSLSATPIPRSLHLALSGLKKISLLTTPPPRKKSVETLISRWDEKIITEAIHNELNRGGQVIILHNRVRSLSLVEREIQELFEIPLKIVTTHGQMPAHEIEEHILAFKQRKFDILLTTTVIENGVNFLGANTIIISDAEEFGLAQLHQIRGRVGRKDIQGICYLLYRKYELSGEERERLMILAENSHLGSGYEIAMRDMQMRGTGDVLGFRQSGKTKEVGISLYFQMLEEKIEALKYGKKQKQECKIDLEVSYAIAPEEFDSEIDKLSFFRDIESIETLSDLDMVESTFRERSISLGMENLFLLVRARIILEQYCVIRVSRVGQNYHFDFQEGTKPDVLRTFLDRFDTEHQMIIVSLTKIKIETKYFSGAKVFLESMIQ